MMSEQQGSNFAERVRIEVRPGVYSRYKMVLGSRKVVTVTTVLIDSFLGSEEIQDRVAKEIGYSCYVGRSPAKTNGKHTRVEVRPEVFYEFQEFVTPGRIVEVATALFRVFIDDEGLQERVLLLVDEVDGDPG